MVMSGMKWLTDFACFDTCVLVFLATVLRTALGIIIISICCKNYAKLKN